MQLADDAAYHVMSRGHNREVIFENDRDLLARYQERFAFELYHYCLLSNHFHLLLRRDNHHGLVGMGEGLSQ
jgi:putative transposase